MNNKQYIQSINTLIEKVIIDLMNKQQIKTATFLRIRLNNYIDIFNKHIQIEDASKGYMLDILQDLIVDKLEDIKIIEELKEIKEIMEEYFLTTMKEDEAKELLKEKAELEKILDNFNDTFNDLRTNVANQLLNSPNYLETDDFNSIILTIKKMEEIKEERDNTAREINKIIDKLY